MAIVLLPQSANRESVTLQTNLTHKRVQEMLNYDPQTGLFTWKKAGPGITVGKVAGHLRKKDGYVMMCLDQEFILGHILAWFYVHGTWPTHELDHDNRIRSDNRIANLRPSTRSLNAFNTNARPGQSGLKGVHPFKGKFRAIITIAGVRNRLGVFSDPLDAARAYDAAALTMVGPVATTNKSLGLIQ